MPQLGLFYFPCTDPLGRAIPQVNVDPYREGAIVNGNQSGTSPLVVTVRHSGKIVSGDTVFLNTTTGTTYAVTAVTTTTVTLSGFAGTLVLNDGDKIVPQNNRPSFYADDQAGGAALTFPLVTDVRGVVQAYAEVAAYTILTSGGATNVTPQIFFGWTVSAEFYAQVRDARSFPGVDAAAKIHNALLDLPAQGGVVDARGLGGTAAAPALFGSDPFSGITSTSIVLVNGYYRTTVALGFAGNGQGYWGTGRNTAVLQMDPTFPASTPLLTINKASGIFGAMTKDLALDCNSVTGSIGALLSGAQEGSGLQRVQAINAKDAGVRVNSAGAGSQQWVLYDVDTSTIGASAVGIDVSGGAGVGTIRRSSCGNSGGVGVAGIRLNTGSVVRISDVHCEQFTHGIQVTAHGGSCVIDNFVGHSSLTNCVKIETAGVECRSIVPNGATNSINDTWSSPNIVITTATAFYNGPDAAGTAALRQQFSSVANIPWFLTTTVNYKRLVGRQGTNLVAGDITLSAGWGNTATVSVTWGTNNSQDSRGRISVTANGTGIAANPNIQWTFKDGAYPVSPVIVVSRGDVAAPSSGYWQNLTTVGTTGLIFFVGTPVAGNTYIVDFIVMG